MPAHQSVRAVHDSGLIAHTVRTRDASLVMQQRCFSAAMSRFSRRILLLLAGALVQACSRRPSCQLLQMGELDTSIPDDGQLCPQRVDAMRVIWDEGRDYWLPLTCEGVTGKCNLVHGEYAQAGREIKTVTLSMDNEGETIYVQAAAFTDYGTFQVAIDSLHSKAHLHDDRICFDLSIEILDGGSSRERWQGTLRRK